jgi:hypothetical protein
MNLHQKARSVIYAIDNHPATGSPIKQFLGSAVIDIMDLCSRGHVRPTDGKIEIRYTPENYVLYSKEFNKEFKEYSEKELKIYRKLTTIWIPYKKLYGEPWKFDHVEYWGELNFTIFRGKDPKKWIKTSDWETYDGVYASGKTFEEMVVKLGKKYFRTFGKFSEKDFLTEKEKSNHATTKAFLPSPRSRPGIYVTVRNPKYIEISPAEINLRWATWFANTPYGKKKWPELLSNKKW